MISQRRQTPNHLSSNNEKFEIMTITERVRALNLPVTDYIVTCSGVLDALGLREASDIDLVVSEPLFEQLKSSGWHEGISMLGDRELLNDGVEAFLVWDNETPEPNLTELKATEMVIDGIPFVSPERVMHWKRHLNRPKDQRDVMLLQQWLRSKQHRT